MDSHIGVLFLVLVCLQNALYTLCRRQAVGVWKQTFSSSAVLILGEIIKGLFALFMQLTTKNNQTASQKVYRIARYSWPMAIPAFVYWCMNLLSYVAIERIDAGVFTVIAQGKILTTALFSVIFLGRDLKKQQWCALLLLCVGVSMISYNVTNLEDSKGKSAYDTMVGIFVTALEITLSGIVSVYFESVVKNKNVLQNFPKLSVWEVNVQLAAFSIMLYFVPFAYDGYFANWTMMATLTSILGALGGILVALSVKYTSSIKKCLAVSGAIVITTVFGHFYQEGPMNVQILIGSAMVISAVFSYNTQKCAKAVESIVSSPKQPYDSVAQSATASEDNA